MILKSVYNKALLLSRLYTEEISRDVVKLRVDGVLVVKFVQTNLHSQMAHYKEMYSYWKCTIQTDLLNATPDPNWSFWTQLNDPATNTPSTGELHSAQFLREWRIRAQRERMCTMPDEYNPSAPRFWPFSSPLPPLFPSQEHNPSKTDCFFSNARDSRARAFLRKLKLKKKKKNTNGNKDFSHLSHK